jgi:hypothetical protein
MTVFVSTYERAHELVGRVHRMDLGPMSRQEFQGFANATGDLTPIYLDDEAPRAAGLTRDVAAPLFLSGVFGWEHRLAEENLRSDGTGYSGTAGQDLESLHPVGDRTHILGDTSLDDVQVKRGRSVPLLLLRILRRYFDDDDLRSSPATNHSSRDELTHVWHGSAELAPLKQRPTDVQLFRYSAVTGNTRFIQYDAAYAQTEDCPNVLVDA